MDFLKQDLEFADDEVLVLEKKILSFKKNVGTYLDKNEVLKIIKKIADTSLSNINLTIPSISDIAKLDLFEVPSTVSIKISCEIDKNDSNHLEIFNEISSFDNITIREYNEKDRYCILRDAEELFFTAVGENSRKLLAFRTKDHNHIKLFNSLVMESYLKGKKI